MWLLLLTIGLAALEQERQCLLAYTKSEVEYFISNALGMRHAPNADCACGAVHVSDILFAYCSSGVWPSYKFEGLSLEECWDIMAKTDTPKFSAPATCSVECTRRHGRFAGIQQADLRDHVSSIRRSIRRHHGELCYECVRMGTGVFTSFACQHRGQHAAHNAADD